MNRSLPAFVYLACAIGACDNAGFSGSGATKTRAPAPKASTPASDDATPAQPGKPSGCRMQRPASAALVDPTATCQITPSGNQATIGVFVVVLTNPAPCDFKLPTVNITGPTSALDFTPTSATVPIGTYWAGTYFGITQDVAHAFALSAEPPAAPVIDNGFILVQPDHRSYLLVDGGLARPTHPSFQNAQAAATQLSQSLGFGDTTLLQPQAGSIADNFATATVFKAGSVIAIYDDTPDMAGDIEVASLIASMQAATATDTSIDPSNDAASSTDPTAPSDPTGGFPAGSEDPCAGELTP